MSQGHITEACYQYFGSTSWSCDNVTRLNYSQPTGTLLHIGGIWSNYPVVLLSSVQVSFYVLFIVIFSCYPSFNSTFFDEIFKSYILCQFLFNSRIDHVLWIYIVYGEFSWTHGYYSGKEKRNIFPWKISNSDSHVMHVSYMSCC